jgi:cation diffusion facilitator family transporter
LKSSLANPGAPGDQEVASLLKGLRQMHRRELDRWRHDHVFGQDQAKAGERRTLLVVLITAGAMVVEIAAGLAFGSMALLADGLHMASHAAALGIASAAYVLARRFAGDDRLSFGTGKVNALAGFSGALLLGVFAVGVGIESVTRLVAPQEIAYWQAILVAVLGLGVNVACAAILMGAGGHHHHHHGGDEVHGHGDPHDHHHGHPHAGEDHNLRAATLHVLADAVTSFLAIFALIGGSVFDAPWLDAAMGIVGAVLIGRWSIQLGLTSSKVLLDWQAPEDVRETLRAALEQGDDAVVDLHVWSIGPGIRAAIAGIVTHDVQPAETYKARLPDDLGIVHLTVETHLCEDARAA